MTEIKLIEKYFIFKILLIVVIVDYLQFTSQHWTALTDTDWFMMYNSLLLSSGYEQKFEEYPAFTTFLINSKLIKFYNFFNSIDNFTVEKLKYIKNLDLYLGDIFIIHRTINSLVHCLTLYIIFKIQEKIGLNYFFNYLIIISFISTNFFWINLFQVKPEIWSIFFFFLAFYLLINFHKKDQKKIVLLISSGFVCGLAFISKIQILFFILFLIMLIPYMQRIVSTKNETSNLGFPYLKLLLMTYLLILLGYTIIEYFIIYQHPNYIGKLKIDLYLYIGFSVFYFLYLKKLSKNSSEFRENLTKYLIFILSFLSVILVLIVIDFFEISKVNNYIYYKFLNPIAILNQRSIDTDYQNVLLTFFDVANFFRPGYSFLIIIFFLGILCFKKFFNLKLFYINFSIGLYLIYLFSHNLRYFELYEIYSYSAVIIFIFLSYDKNWKYLRNLFLLILIIYNLNNTFLNNNFKENFHRANPLDAMICNELEGSILYKHKAWTKRLDNEFFIKTCESYNENLTFQKL
jgi:hypothetical protein